MALTPREEFFGGPGFTQGRDIEAEREREEEDRKRREEEERRRAEGGAARSFAKEALDVAVGKTDPSAVAADVGRSALEIARSKTVTSFAPKTFGEPEPDAEVEAALPPVDTRTPAQKLTDQPQPEVVGPEDRSARGFIERLPKKIAAAINAAIATPGAPIISDLKDNDAKELLEALVILNDRFSVATGFLQDESGIGFSVGSSARGTIDFQKKEKESREAKGEAPRSEAVSAAFDEFLISRRKIAGLPALVDELEQIAKDETRLKSESDARSLKMRSLNPVLRSKQLRDQARSFSEQKNAPKTPKTRRWEENFVKEQLELDRQGMKKMAELNQGNRRQRNKGALRKSEIRAVRPGLEDAARKGADEDAKELEAKFAFDEQAAFDKAALAARDQQIKDLQAANKVQVERRKSATDDAVILGLDRSIESNNQRILRLLGLEDGGGGQPGQPGQQAQPSPEAQKVADEKDAKFREFKAALLADNIPEQEAHRLAIEQTEQFFAERR